MEEQYGLCETCGKRFLMYRSFQKYCCNKCRQIATEKNNYGYIKKDYAKKKCKICGEEFTTNNKKKVYCSHECYKKGLELINRKKKPDKRICAHCGTEFLSAHCSKKYCTTECYQKAKKARERHEN